MRIGILSFEEALTSKTLRGVSTTTRYLQENLRATGLNVDLLVYGKGKLNYPLGFNIVSHYENLEELANIRDNYDFIIYYTPGRSLEKYDEKVPNKYCDVLDKIRLPFTFIYHSEEYVKHQPYRLNFINHPDCKFLTFIVEGFKDVYKDDLAMKPEYFVMSMRPPLNSLESILNRNKTNSVIITSVWTNFKRNLEYFQLVGKFLDLGITPYSAGSPASNFYMNDILDSLVSDIELIYDKEKKQDDRSLAKYRDYLSMLSYLKLDMPWRKDEESKMPKVIGAYLHTKSGHKWYDYGAYYPEDMPAILADKKFHWNISCYKVNKTYIPKFETVTLEAFNEGCLPVICKETTPEEVPEDSAIRLSKIDYAEHLDILSEMSDEERTRRLIKFYELLRDTSMYENFKKTLEELI